MNKVSVLGCGWLGLPLAEKLIKEGYNVKGSTTSELKLEILASKNIKPYDIALPIEEIPSDFFDSDYLVINIPPRTRSEDTNFHLSCIKSILPYVPEKLKIIYISSTSVYPDLNRKITEKDDVDRNSERSKALWKVEDLLKNNFKNRLTIIRMGGLLGYDRIPGKYFSGKKVTDANKKVNYIHRDDAIEIILCIINRNKFPELFNGVAPLHPSRKKVYQQNSEKLDFEPPVFEEEENIDSLRIISGEKLVHNLDYSFIYPDPRHFHYTN